MTGVSSSVAVPVTVTWARSGTIAPLTGEVIEIFGGVLSKINVIAAVPLFPARSVPVAVMLLLPSASVIGAEVKVAAPASTVAATPFTNTVAESSA